MNKKKLNLAWLDLRNAFGSIPHFVIKHTLRHMGVPKDMVTLCGNIYTDGITKISTPTGLTNDIPINSGVKQGCPMSPILFNLCIELILRWIKEEAVKIKSGTCNHFGTDLSCLAYADDLVLMARSKDTLQRLLYAAAEAANTLGLNFRPDKCATLSLTSTRQRATFVEPTDFTIQGEHIPALSQEESYRYLGVPIGLIHNIDDIPSIVPKLIQHINIIRSSLLAPWQKLDAIRTFIQPCLTYALRAGNPLKQSLDEYKRILVSALKDICFLPQRATQSYFFAHKKVGGLSMFDPRTECDIQAIVQGLRMLSSSDPNITAMAKHELKYIVRRSTQLNPTADLISVYLSSTKDPRTDRLYYSYSSLWSRVRQACRRLSVTFSFSDYDPPTINADESPAIKSDKATYFLHQLVLDRHSKYLTEIVDQGKVARCLADDQYANGSSWQCTNESNHDNNKPQYKVLSSPGTTRSRGVAVLYHPSLTVLHSASNSQGRLQVIHFTFHSRPFQFVNVYGPNQKQPGVTFFQSILPLLDPSLPTIVCGDFNTVVDATIDRIGCSPQSPWAYNWPHTLAALTTNLDLVDIWRQRHPHERAYTWTRVAARWAHD